MVPKMSKLRFVLTLSLLGITLAPPIRHVTYAASAQPLIAFSQEGLENSWRIVNTHDMLDSGKKAGFNMIWEQANADESRQVAQVQDLLKRRPAVLVVEPAEQQAATPIEQLATAAHVPLIVVDRSIGVSPPKGEYRQLISIDWTQMGVDYGKVAVAYLTKKYGKPAGNIVEIAGVIGSSPELGLDAGFHQVIQKYPGIKIIANQDGQNARAPGLSIMEDYLTRYPAGKIQLVWAQNDEMGLGALKAINAAGRTELFGAILGKDVELQGLKEVVDGTFLADCTVPPYYGHEVMPAVRAILAGKRIPSYIKSSFTCYTSLTPAARSKAKATYDYLTKNNIAYAH